MHTHKSNQLSNTLRVLVRILPNVFVRRESNCEKCNANFNECLNFDCYSIWIDRMDERASERANDHMNKWHGRFVQTKELIVSFKCRLPIEFRWHKIQNNDINSISIYFTYHTHTRTHFMVYEQNIAFEVKSQIILRANAEKNASKWTFPCFVCVHALK